MAQIKMNCLPDGQYRIARQISSLVSLLGRIFLFRRTDAKKKDGK
jgi:hypothetical protein